VDAAKLFYDLKERCIFCDIIRYETTAGVRLISETDRFTVLAPYAPRFPFETGFCPSATNPISRMPMRPPWPTSPGCSAPPFASSKSAGTAGLHFIVHSTPVQEGPLVHYTGTSRSSQHYQGRRLRMGQRLLHQPDSSGRVRQVLREAGVG